MGPVQGTIPHVSGQISQGIQEGNEALRNSTGVGAWVVFLTYFCLGLWFQKHPSTLTAQAGLQGNSALGSPGEGITSKAKAPHSPAPKSTMRRPMDLLKARSGFGFVQSNFQAAIMQEIPPGAYDLLEAQQPLLEG